ncbi:phasin family protein [Microvirga sp. TS319]|uniref:phasin family protein n=1 Tax=Microvirga sp. TS319 TaxID=3241165 RepID=UPI00351A2545
MTETRKTRTRTAKSAPKADLIELAAKPAAEATEAMQAPEPAPAPKAFVSAAEPESEPFALSLRDQGEVIRRAMRETVAASAKGALEVNEKVIEALQIQGHAAIDLWRTALDNSRGPEGFKAQTGAARQAFEAATAPWKDVAEATARWMARSVEPLQSAFLRPTR